MRGRHSNEGTRRDEWVSRVVSRQVEQLGSPSDDKYRSGGFGHCRSVGNRTNPSSEDMGNGNVTTPLEGNLTEAEVAAYLRTSRRTLRNLRRKGSGPKYARVGRQIIYRLVELQEWQAAQTQAGSRRTSACEARA